MRIIVTGDRRWYCLEIAEWVVGRLMDRHGAALTIVHGAAPGVDSAFADACNNSGVKHEPHPAEWKAYGNGAGPRRNAAMVATGADLCIAVHRDIRGSRGTKDCARRCLAAGIPTWLIDSEDFRPRRIGREWLESRP